MSSINSEVTLERLLRDPWRFVRLNNEVQRTIDKLIRNGEICEEDGKLVANLFPAMYLKLREAERWIGKRTTDDTDFTDVF